MSTIILAGRHFHAATSTTLRHDLSTQAQIVRAGIATLTMQENETVDTFLVRFAREGKHDPAVLRLLAHVLVPVGTVGARWSPDTADEVTAYLAASTGDDDEQDAALEAQLLGMLEGLLRSGAVTLMRPSFVHA